MIHRVLYFVVFTKYFFTCIPYHVLVSEQLRHHKSAFPSCFKITSYLIILILIPEKSTILSYNGMIEGLILDPNYPQ